MKGTRPLSNHEIRLVSACFEGQFETRNRSLFMLGVSTGGRISELLGLQIGDIYQNGAPVTDLLFNKNIVKGQSTARLVPVNSDGVLAIDALLQWYRDRASELGTHLPAFPSRNKKGTVAMSRRTAHDVLKVAFQGAGLNGHIATHSLRKSFAQRLYDQCDDIYVVQEMLGHQNVATTQKYLGVNYEQVKQALEDMSLTGELHRTSLLGSSLKTESDETLFLELALRGYDLSILRDHTPHTGEIIKIG